MMQEPLILEPAPARFSFKEGMWESPHHIAEAKVDGWRFLMHLGGQRMYLTGRRVSVKTGKFSEKGLCAPMLAPRKRTPSKLTIIDGEVMPPLGRGFGDIAGIMNVSPEEAAKRIKEIGPPRYFAFDILFYKGEDVRAWTFQKRRDLLTQVLDIYFADHSLVEHVSWNRSNKYRFYEEILEAGGEGVIIKHLGAPYGQMWTKVKRQSTLDVVITGFTQANEGKTGKFKGLIGAVKVSVYREYAAGDAQDGSTSIVRKLEEIGQVSGMTDEMRREFTANPDKYLGTVIEVKAQEMAKDRLRHPRFSRLRPEASPKDCTWEKLQQDLAASSTGGKK